MNTTKWLTCALLGIGLAMPMAEIMATSARADENSAAAAAPDRKTKHNRQWKNAKKRAHEAARHGNAKKVVQDFKEALNSPDIVVNVCVVNIINKADNVVAIGGSVDQVINVIDGANCEIN